MKKLDPGKDPLLKLLVHYALPLVGSYLFMQLYFVVDGIFVGNFVGPTGLAAINLFLPVSMLSTSLSVMIAVGGSTITNISLGAGDIPKARSQFTLTLTLVFVTSIIFTTCFIIFKEPVIHFLGAKEDTYHLVDDYLSTVILFYPFVLIAYVLDMFLRAEGLPHYPAIVMAIVTVINIGLDYLFLGPFNMGLKGAALATGISQTGAALALAAPFIIKNTKLKLTKPLLSIPVIFRMLANGMSEFLESISLSITFLLFNWVISDIMGTIGVSAISIVNYIVGIVIIIIIAVAQSIQPIISFNFGAENHDRIKKLLRLTGIATFIIGVLGYIGMNIFAEPLTALFVGDNLELQEIVTQASRFVAISFIFSGFGMLGSIFFTAIEKALLSAVISSSRSLIFIVIGLLILPGLFGMTGFWLVLPFSEIMTAIIAFVFYKKWGDTRRISKYSRPSPQNQI